MGGIEANGTLVEGTLIQHKKSHKAFSSRHVFFWIHFLSYDRFVLVLIRKANLGKANRDFWSRTD